MRQFLIALTFAALPALGNFLGGLLAEITRLSDKALSAALHVAAGIILAVVGIELVGRGLAAAPAWAIALALMGGGLFAVLLDLLLSHIRCRFGGNTSREGPWMIYVGVSADLFSDGVMIGAGATIASSLALLLALGQMAGDIPEGFATMANFKRHGFLRSRRMLIAASFAVPILIGATVGYWAVREQPEVYKFVLLAFTAGILITVAIEEMVTQAHRMNATGEESAWESLGLVGGFALFVLLSAYLG